MPTASWSGTIAVARPLPSVLASIEKLPSENVMALPEGAPRSVAPTGRLSPDMPLVGPGSSVVVVGVVAGGVGAPTGTPGV